MKIVVDGAGFKELNQEYVATSADEIPTGIFPFDKFLSDPGPIIDHNMQILQTEPTKPNLPNQTYQTKPTKPNLPNQTYLTKPT